MYMLTYEAATSDPIETWIEPPVFLRVDERD
jgi:hypothetical protein